jgi:hypothetical protein
MCFRRLDKSHASFPASVLFAASEALAEEGSEAETKSAYSRIGSISNAEANRATCHNRPLSELTVPPR